MGTAIALGLIKAGLDPARVCVTTKTQASATKLANSLGVQAIALETEPRGNEIAVTDADLVLVAVKPAFVIPTLTQVAGDLHPDALVVSVAAGVPTSLAAGPSRARAPWYRPRQNCLPRGLPRRESQGPGAGATPPDRPGNGPPGRRSRSGRSACARVAHAWASERRSRGRSSRAGE